MVAVQRTMGKSIMRVQYKQTTHYAAVVDAYTAGGRYLYMRIIGIIEVNRGSNNTIVL